MRVLSVASEAYPLVKTGGLADVAGALPPALARRGIEVRTLLPGYPAVMRRLPHDTRLLHAVALVAHGFLLWTSRPAPTDENGSPMWGAARSHPP